MNSRPALTDIFLNFALHCNPRWHRMDIEELLSQKINLPQIKNIVSWTCRSRDNRLRLWILACSDDRRTSLNALWTMTHLPASESEWLLSMRDNMIDILLAEKDMAKKRMLLQILGKQDYTPENIRADFLDYCMSRINSRHEPYAIRCLSLHISFNMCRHYPELMAELKTQIDMMAYQSLSPGLESALRQTKCKIRKLKM